MKAEERIGDYNIIEMEEKETSTSFKFPDYTVQF